VENNMTQLKDELKNLLKTIRSQEKAVSRLLEARQDNNGPGLMAALASIDEKALEGLGLGQSPASAIQDAREKLDELRFQMRRSLIHELESSCKEKGRAFKRLGDSPPELLLAPLTLTIDLSRLEAVVFFGRHELVRTPADAGKILDAVEAQEKALTKGQHTPERFIEELFFAYRAVLGRLGKTMGERIDIAEILPYVALLRQGPGFCSDPLRETFKSFGRAHFLFGLSRLRSLRILEYQEYRLDLGTATGDSAKKKKRVFFIPDGLGGGQLYLSIRFLRRPGRVAR